MTHQNLGKIERGKVPLGEAHLGKLAAILRIEPADLYRDPEDGASAPVAPMVKVVGYVGAGDAAHYYDASQGPIDLVPAPSRYTPTTVAAEVRGVSIGRKFDGWLVFWDEVRSPVTPDILHELCVIGLLDGRILVKWLEPSKSPGVYHLISETEPPMLDQEVEWAAKVTEMRPRR